MPTRSHISTEKTADSSRTHISQREQTASSTEANRTSPSFIRKTANTSNSETVSQPKRPIRTAVKVHSIKNTIGFLFIIFISASLIIAAYKAMIQISAIFKKYGILTSALALINLIALSTTLVPDWDRKHVLAALPHYLYVLVNVSFLDTMVSTSMAENQFIDEITMMTEGKGFFLGAIYLSLCLTLFVETWINLCYMYDDKSKRRTVWYKYSTIFAVMGTLSFAYYIPVIINIENGADAPLLSVTFAIFIALIGLLTFTYLNKCLSKRIEGENSSRP